MVFRLCLQFIEAYVLLVRNVIAVYMVGHNEEVKHYTTSLDVATMSNNVQQLSYRMQQT